MSDNKPLEDWKTIDWATAGITVVRRTQHNSLNGSIFDHYTFYREDTQYTATVQRKSVPAKINRSVGETLQLAIDQLCRASLVIFTNRPSMVDKVIK